MSGCRSQVGIRREHGHFHVAVIAYKYCRQSFVNIVPELADDMRCSAYTYSHTLPPLIEAEVMDLLSNGSVVTETELEALAPERRNLYYAQGGKTR